MCSTVLFRFAKTFRPFLKCALRFSNRSAGTNFADSTNFVDFTNFVTFADFANFARCDSSLEGRRNNAPPKCCRIRASAKPEIEGGFH